MCDLQRGDGPGAKTCHDLAQRRCCQLGWACQPGSSKKNLGTFKSHLQHGDGPGSGAPCLVPDIHFPLQLRVCVLAAHGGRMCLHQAPNKTVDCAHESSGIIVLRAGSLVARADVLTA